MGFEQRNCDAKYLSVVRIRIYVDNLSRKNIRAIQSHMEQEYPRGSIVDPPDLQQDGLNYLPHSGLISPIMYDIFKLQKKRN